MFKQPTVTVLMSVFNDASFLSEAMQSILHQTWTDFEFIVINDASTDASGKLLSSFKDPRIKIFNNEVNLGLTRSLNRGLKLAKGKYIARIDADDIALPERLAQQVEYLEENPDVGIVGSYLYLINDQSHILKLLKYPCQDLWIRWTSLIMSPFAHPSVMFRASVLEQHELSYDNTFDVAQDYKLWINLLEYTYGSNLTKPLTKHRLHNQRISKIKSQKQLNNHDIISYSVIRSQLPSFKVSKAQVTQMRAIFMRSDSLAKDGIKTTDDWNKTVSLYVELLKAFLNKYSNHPERYQVKQKASLRISQFILGRNRQAGWQKIILTLIIWNPLLLVYIFGYGIEKILRKLKVAT